MKKTNKKGFTMVELVIVIAVVAILAAVLIPTFLNLTKKANEATALAEARNMANQLLTNLLERGEQAKDLVVIQQKSDGIYVHAYSVEEARVIAYKGNPIDPASLTTAQAEEGEKSAFEKSVEAILADLQSQGAILPLAEQPKTEDWWHPEQMKAIAKTLEFDTDKTCFRADFKVIVAAFEEKVVDPAHQCNKDNLTYFEGQAATCTAAGWDEYWMCPVCGQLYVKNDKDELEKTDKIPEIAQLGHDWNEGEVTKAANCTQEGVRTLTCENCGNTMTEKINKDPNNHDYSTAWSADGTNHWHECTRCDAAGTKEAHSNLKNYYKQNDKYYGTCTCGYDVELTESNTTNLAVYKHAMDLNEILAKDSENPTMYDAFSWIASQQSSKSIKDVISAIDQAEGTSGLKIVWDQTIDRFSVVSDSNNIVTVHYTMKDADGLSGTLDVASAESLALWDVYDDTNNIPTYQFLKTYFVYSIYWNGTNAPAKNYSNSDTRHIHTGFDMGEWKCEGSFSMTMQASVLNHAVKYDAIIIRTNGDINLTIGAAANVKHYGSADTIQIGIYGFQSLNIYEFGAVKTVQKASTGADCSQYTIHAMEGSKFAQSKAVIEALGCTVVNNGGAFEQTLG